MWILICASVLAVGIASVATGAVGSAVRIGERNAASGTTAIVGTTSGYATRQSNAQNGDGGAASYGCRADANHESCLYVLNHSGGRVFTFQANGGATNAGIIGVAPPAGKTADDVRPFTTNAHGVATGLNADQVDGQSASDLTAAAQAAIDKAKPLFAAVNADGTIAGNRGLAQANAVQRTGEGAYTVTFGSDISKCAYTATETTTTDAGAAAVAPVANSTVALAIVTRAGGGADGTGPTGPADRPFHLVVNC
ncbi:MAG: hypothetical protein QOJ57_384 [Thermoleophilaceae bacterium]|nr:hypothetical protein [Thermoleophilaceae bacterium]